ncbi:MAG: response regulator transcription factor [Chitinophagaceae bacterium]|nr:response regulator transcription factor [Chitinophagaceae bacterium]
MQGIKQNSILIVDDEQHITELIQYNLLNAGFKTYVAHNGIEAIQVARQANPDLILLDVNMPKKDGYQTCKELRTIPSLQHTIIIFLTAMSDETSEIKGLELGADDYIAKPIKPNLLITRIKSALRKVVKEDADNELEFNGLTIHKSEYNITLDGVVVTLARKEFELLFMLASKPGKVFDRNEILQKIWGSEVIVGDRTIDVHIRKIRQKLNEKYIFTVKGVGYKFHD